MNLTREGRAFSVKFAAALFVALVIVRDFAVLRYALTAPRALGAPALSALGRDALCLGAAAALLAGFWAAGGFLWPRLSPKTEPVLEHVGRLALGLGAFGLTLFFLGLTGQLRPFLLLLIAVVAVAAAVLELAKRFRPGKPALEGGLFAALAALIAFAAFHAAVLGLAPPTEWDCLAYHLALPKLYLRAGRVVELPWLLHSHWPRLMELVYALPLSAGLEETAALLHAGVCAAWIWVAAKEGERALGRTAAWLGAALLCAQPAVLRAAGAAHSDGAWSLFHLLAGLCLARRGEDGERRWLDASALFAGLAASAKLLGLLSLPGWCLWVVLDRKAGPRAAARYAALALLVWAPWPAATWLWTGNPVWPFLPRLFGGPAFVGAYVRSNLAPWPPPAWLLLRNGLPFLVLPLGAALALAPARSSKWPTLLKVLWFPLPLHLALTFSHQEAARFLMPFYPAAALTTAWACARSLESRALVPRAAAAAALAIGLSPLLAATQNNALFAVLGLRSQSRPDAAPRELYLERALPGYEGMAAANAALAGRPGRVLLFREIRGYYLDADYEWGDPVNQGALDYASLPDGKALAARLRELGITHVLVNQGLELYRPGAGVYGEREQALMDDVLQGATRLSSADGVALYALAQPLARR